MPLPRPEIIAYLAGFFDGEGCIRVAVNRASVSNGKNPIYRLVMLVNQRTDHREPLELLQETFGGNLNDMRNGTERNAPTSSWQLGGRKAEAALEQMLPYLRVKHVHARAALAFFAWRHVMGLMRNTGPNHPMNPEEVTTLESFHKFFAFLNKRGPREESVNDVPVDFSLSAWFTDQIN